MDTFMILSTTQIKTDTILDLVLGAVKKFVLKNDDNAAYFVLLLLPPQPAPPPPLIYPTRATLYSLTNILCTYVEFYVRTQTLLTAIFSFYFLKKKVFFFT